MYALLFADTGLSTAQITSLLVIWSVVPVVLELPSGAIADLLPRRALLTGAALIRGAGFGLWVIAPGYLSFAAGFVLWGAGSALESGTYESYVYDQLRAGGAVDRYRSVISSGRTGGLVLNLTATVLAAPLLAVSGFGLVGAVSAAACGAQAVLTAMLPADIRDSGAPAERDGQGQQAVPTCQGQQTVPGAAPSSGPEPDHRPPSSCGTELGEDSAPQGGTAPDTGTEPESDSTPSHRHMPNGSAEPPGDPTPNHDPKPIDRAEPSHDSTPQGVRGMLRTGLGEAMRVRAVRRALVLAVLLPMFGVLDEYFGLLARDLHTPTDAVPLLVASTVAAQAAGAFAARRWPARWVGPAVFAAAVLIGGGALLRVPTGFLGVALGYGLFEMTAVVVQTGLQDAITGRARATVTSVAGMLVDALTIVLLGAIALGSTVLSVVGIVVGLSAGLLPVGALAARWIRRPGPAGPADLTGISPRGRSAGPSG